MTKAALLVVLLLGCGTVTADPKDGAAGTGGGEIATGGAGGELGGRGGQLGTGGAAGGVLTAPACKGNFIGPADPSVDICPRIPDPNDPTNNPNGGWQCEVGCSDNAAEDATGCVFNGVTYCVASCSDCRP